VSKVEQIKTRKMHSIKSKFICFALLIVILSMATPEVEGRRLVLRGRRTITRHYYSRMALPAWVVIVLVGLADLIIGAILYFVLKKVVLSPPAEASNTYQPALLDDA